MRRRIAVALALATVTPAGQRLQTRLAEGGAKITPFGPTFWSPGFDVVRGRFVAHGIIGVQASA